VLSLSRQELAIGEKGQSSQEERDALLGRAFACLAIIRAGGVDGDGEAQVEGWWGAAVEACSSYSDMGLDEVCMANEKKEEGARDRILLKALLSPFSFFFFFSQYFFFFFFFFLQNYISHNIPPPPKKTRKSDVLRDRQERQEEQKGQGQGRCK
jgi:hypothetical protein